MKGKILGGALLIAGSCIGAGMLAIPIALGLSGWFPSIFAFFFVWAFMTSTAIILVEVNSWFSDRVNLLTMIETYLGRKAKILGSIVYIGLFYSLLVAYISVGSGLMGRYFSFLSPGLYSLLLSFFLGCLVLWGTRVVDLCNRWLIFLLGVSYVGLLFLVTPLIEARFLQYQDWSLSFLGVPVLITSFGFHNMIPSLYYYVDQDLKAVKKMIFYGSLLVLLCYFLWNLVVIGSLPEKSIRFFYKEGIEAGEALSYSLKKQNIGFWVMSFSFFAIVTSFLAQTLSLMHFLADALHVPLKGKNKVFLGCLTLLPPLVFAFIYPKVFFQALSFAGGICAVILFGFFPVCMLYKGLYKQEKKSMTIFREKYVLLGIFFCALIILLIELAKVTGVYHV